MRLYLLIFTTVNFHEFFGNLKFEFSRKNQHLKLTILRILAFSIKSDLSGNTVWPQAAGLQNLAKMDLFGIFYQNVNIRNIECDF